jgi:hypothetical protein
VSDAARLRQAAELFVKLARDAGRELALDEAGVEWAEAYVRAVRPVDSPDQLRVQTALVGSYLGEALIAVYGGAWSDAEGEWAVELGERGRAHPFRVTEAQLRGDAGPSVVELFRSFSDDAPAGEADEDDSTAPLRATAERFREVIAANGGPAEYGEALVAFVDEFVANARPVEAELLEQYTALVGAALGESLIADYRGEWRHTGDAWIVRLPDDTAVWPFAAARKQLEGGPEDSILALFRQARPKGEADGTAEE